MRKQKKTTKPSYKELEIRCMQLDEENSSLRLKDFRQFIEITILTDNCKKVPKLLQKMFGFITYNVGNGNITLKGKTIPDKYKELAELLK